MSITEALSTIQSGKGGIYTIGCLVCFDHPLEFIISITVATRFTHSMTSLRIAFLQPLFLMSQKHGYYSANLETHYAQVQSVQFASLMAITVILPFVTSSNLIIKSKDHHSSIIPNRMVYWFSLFFCRREKNCLTSSVTCSGRFDL